MMKILSNFSIVACAFMFGVDYASILLYRFITKKQNVPHNARWFFIHAITNLMVCALGYKDVIYCLTNIDKCFQTPWNTKSLYTFELAIISHLYHIVMFFKNLKRDEWVHHIVMLGLAAPVTILKPSRATTVGLFFMTGLPGFTDYLLLWMVKLGKLNPMSEKLFYTWISMWLRSPGCLLACFLAIPSLIKKPNIYVILQVLLTFWNGQYYLAKTCIDYGKKSMNTNKNNSNDKTARTAA